MTADLLTLRLPQSLTSQYSLRFSNGSQRPGSRLLLPRRHPISHLFSSRPTKLTISNTLEASRVPRTVQSPQTRTIEPSVLLDVTGMMCGGCVSRVRTVLSADDRVDSVVVNMLTETAAVKLKQDVVSGDLDMAGLAEDLASRLTDCGFPSKRRMSEMGVAENVRKWKDMANKKQDELLTKSRNRVAFAWTLVALCCGSHASHILHSLGIHIAHGSFWDCLHNSYVKGGLSLGALLGPGRG